VLNRAVLAFLLFSAAPSTSRATGGEVAFNTWAGEQWSSLPRGQRASVPVVRISVDEVTRRRLDVHADPLSRNIYISSVYAMMGKELASCANPGVQLGNWYHFATWASVSAGEVISRRKFAALDGPSRAALWIGAAAQYIPTQDTRVEIIANTNMLIALEMVPIGRAFLDTFCVEPRTPRPFSDFSSLFTPAEEHERMLVDAFALYHEAIYEEDVARRVELVTAASILQVVSEQTRVDQLINAFFASDFGVAAATSFYRGAATDAGALHVGTDAPLRLELDDDIPAIRVSAR